MKLKNFSHVFANVVTFSKKIKEIDRKLQNLLEKNAQIIFTAFSPKTNKKLIQNMTEKIIKDEIMN